MFSIFLDVTFLDQIKNHYFASKCDMYKYACICICIMCIYLYLIIYIYNPIWVLKSIPFFATAATS